MSSADSAYNQSLLVLFFTICHFSGLSAVHVKYCQFNILFIHYSTARCVKKHSIIIIIKYFLSIQNINKKCECTDSEYIQVGWGRAAVRAPNSQSREPKFESS